MVSSNGFDMSEATPVAFSILIPAFNEAQGLPTVLAEVVQTCPEAEIIVVDDGSTDGTRRVAEQLPVAVISHPRNLGKGAALKTGIAHAKHEFLVFFDGDGQHDPANIRPMLEHLKDADVVIGERTSYTRRSPLYFAGRFILSRLINFLTRMPLRDINCGLRAVRRSVIQRYLNLLPDGFSICTTSTVVFAKFRHRVVFFPVRVRPRIGRSTVRLFRDGYNTLLLIIRLVALFDPLRVFLPPAFVLMATGVVYGLFIYSRAHAGLSVGALSLLLTGFMVFLLGVICDQIAALRLDRYRDRR